MRWQAFRNVLVQVHLWVALILCVPMIVIGVSGSALLLQREILAASIPSADVSGERRPIPDIVAAAKASAPAGMVANRVELPLKVGAASSVRFRPPREGAASIDIYVDPVSLKILGSSEVVERGPVLAFLIGIHAFLAMPPPIGLPFVGWMGVVMTLMGLTGLVLWWPSKGQWRRSFLVRRGARGLAFHFDLHRAAGIWGLLVFLAVTTSGIYLTFPQTIGPFVRAHLPGEETTTEPQPGYVLAKGRIGPEEAIALARSAVPSARVTGLELPTTEKSFVVDLEPRDLGPTQPRVLVVLDADSGAVTYIDDPRNYSFREKLLNWQHLLHFGVGFGWPWAILVFLSGLLPSLLAVTGITVWWKKRQARSGRARAGAEAVEPVTLSSRT
ncbi:MAG TPA: PepSY-associated TM helix domain-containing protein [Micropepsaceae bacterium]|nr:PepSY-associated TM helix domain-containing protein [Micropepsaceae bacterium]